MPRVCFFLILVPGPNAACILFKVSLSFDHTPFHSLIAEDGDIRVFHENNTS